MSMKSEQQQEEEWAVFGDANCDNSTNETSWFSSHVAVENGTIANTSSRIEEGSRLDSKDFDDWQEFSSTVKSGPEQCSNTLNSTQSIKQDPDSTRPPHNGMMRTSLNSSTIDVTSSRKIMEECFPRTQPSSPSSSSSSPGQNLVTSIDKSTLVELRTMAVSLNSFEWSRCLIRDQFLLTMVAYEQELKDKGNLPEEIDLSGFDEFDRSVPVDTTRQASLDSEASNGVRFSPEDEFQGLFRPPCSRVDSPIELEFDHDKAVLGLSMLPQNDLTTMKNEMTTKVTKLSNELVSLLQSRDILQLETVTKNRFIQAMLRVQESKHAMQNTPGLEGSVDDRGTPSPVGGEETRSLKRKSRSRSFHNLSRSLLAKAKSLGTTTIEEDKTSSEMLLRVVIPYKPDISGSSWSVPLLKQWTKILLAMVDKSPNVSSLISDYLTSVIDSDQQHIQQSSSRSQTSSLESVDSNS